MAARRIVSNHASVLACVRLSAAETVRLELPLAHFSSTITSVFTLQERILALDHRWPVLTYDGRDRQYWLAVYIMGESLYLGDQWLSLCQRNHFNENTIVTVWYYRDQRAPHNGALQLVVTAEAVNDSDACVNCARVLFRG